MDKLFLMTLTASFVIIAVIMARIFLKKFISSFFSSEKTNNKRTEEIQRLINEHKEV